MLWGRAWLRELLASLCFIGLMVGLDGSLRQIYFRVGTVGERALSSPVPWVFTAAWAAILTGLLQLLPQRARRVATGAAGGFFCLLFLTHALLHRAKGTFFSFSILIFAADGFKFMDASYLRIRKLVWLIFFCGLAATAAAVALVPPGKRGLRRRLPSLALVLLGILAIRLNVKQNLTARLQIHFNMHQDSLLYEDFTDTNECVLLAGMYQHAFRDFCLTYGVYDRLNLAGNGDAVKALDAWYAGKAPDPDNEWTGRFAGKNVLLIQLEAIDTWMVTEEFMPNLCRIQRESLDFTQHYTPLYLDAGTFNTEMIVNTGLVSPFTGSASSMYSRNAYPDSLANLLTAEGYTARSFHRSGGDTYNRAVIHENWGYEHYYSGEEMGIPPEGLDFDTELLRAYDLMTGERPFLSLIITYSAHGPYGGSDVSARYYGFAAGRLPEDTDEMVVHAYAHAYETDLFLGRLYDRLEEDGLLEDTALVLYSDHFDYYLGDDAAVMAQKGVWDENLMTRTPCMIYEKHTPPMKIGKATGSYDLLPTLVNLLGLDNDGTHYVGNDVFSEGGGYAIFPDYSWYDGETYYNAKEDGVPEGAVAARSEELRRRLQMSWDTMRLNYFGR